MSAQLRVSLHHVATRSCSGIHHSPHAAPTEGRLVNGTKPYSKVAERNHSNANRRPSRALICANVLQSKQFSYVDLMHSNTMQYVLTLSAHASLRVPFVLLWCIHWALWKTARMKLYTEPSLAEVTPPIIHPSCWQPAGRIISKGLRCTLRYESEDYWRQTIVWSGEWPDWLRAPLAPITGRHLKSESNKNLMDDPEHLISW